METIERSAREWLSDHGIIPYKECIRVVISYILWNRGTYFQPDITEELLVLCYRIVENEREREMRELEEKMRNSSLNPDIEEL